MKKRKYIDKRDWKETNERYVKVGYFYFNPEFLLTWNDELKQMNKGKIGQPYLYPESMIKFLAVLHCKFDFRGLEGFMRWLSENYKFEFPVIDYSQICRRYNLLKIDFNILEEDMKDYLEVGIDGSGEKSTKRGGWMREKWKVKKGWIKVVIMGAKNKNMFDLCEKYNIPTAIKLRDNCSVRTKSPRRKKEVKIYKSMPYEEWSREKNYGQRWPITEGIFSGCKRIMGEYVSATKKRNMYHEVKVKFWAYNLFQEIT